MWKLGGTMASVHNKCLMHKIRICGQTVYTEEIVKSQNSMRILGSKYYIWKLGGTMASVHNKCLMHKIRKCGQTLHTTCFEEIGLTWNSKYDTLTNSHRAFYFLWIRLTKRGLLCQFEKSNVFINHNISGRVLIKLRYQCLLEIVFEVRNQVQYLFTLLLETIFSICSSCKWCNYHCTTLEQTKNHF